jgi:hypothetical protein
MSIQLKAGNHGDDPDSSRTRQSKSEAKECSESRWKFGQGETRRALVF